ncbi:MAG: O-antigen ligase family protein [Anaerolineales bacterium]|nr:O-antigen ligase family protein [Anaerolineales bacterium]
MGRYDKGSTETIMIPRLFQLGIALLIGLAIGALLIVTWSFPAQWQQLLLALPVAFAFVMIINDLEKIILAAIAIGLPLNLDISLIISPYAHNTENIARGNITIVALTELRLSLTILVLVVGYALWIVKRREGNNNPVRFYAATSVPALAFIFISMFSTFQSRDWQLSFFRIVQLCELFLIYFYLANHLRNIDRIRFFVVVLMWGLLAESILMILQWGTGLTFSIAGITTEAATNPVRVGGTLGINAAGGILSAHLAVICAMIWIFEKWPQKIFAITCLVAALIAIIATKSRASWGASLAALLAFFLIGQWRKWMRREALLLLLVGTLVFSAIFAPVIYPRLTTSDSGSAASRARLVKLAWNVIKSHLWLGVGANNYALVAADYYTPDIGNLGDVIYQSVHNRYLLIWAETGLFGILAFVSLLLSSIAQAWRHIRSDDHVRSLMAMGLGCSIFAVSIYMTASHFSPRPSVLYLWLMISLICSLSNLVPVQAKASP